MNIFKLKYFNHDDFIKCIQRKKINSLNQRKIERMSRKKNNSC